MKRRPSGDRNGENLAPAQPCNADLTQSLEFTRRRRNSLIQRGITARQQAKRGIEAVTQRRIGVLYLGQGSPAKRQAGTAHRKQPVKALANRAVIILSCNDCRGLLDQTVLVGAFHIPVRTRSRAEIGEVRHLAQECIAGAVELGPINNHKTKALERGLAVPATWKPLAAASCQGVSHDCLAGVTLAVENEPVSGRLPEFESRNILGDIAYRVTFSHRFKNRLAAKFAKPALRTRLRIAEAEIGPGSCTAGGKIGVERTIQINCARIGFARCFVRL